MNSVKKIKPKWFVIIGAVLLVFGIGGTLISVLDAAGTSIADFVAWDAELPDEGFAPIIAPVQAVGEEGSAPELILSATPTRIVTPQPTEEGGQASPTPEPTPTRIAVNPDRIVMPSIKLDAPIVASKPKEKTIGGETYEQFEAPNKFAVGWQTNSAVLGQAGNSVFNGHHNVDGKVFEHLSEIEPGETFYLMGGTVQYEYMVVNVMILPERDMDVQTRLENARWILPSDDERVTLVTCWPAWSNTHRLIVVGKPMGGPEPVMTPADSR